MANITPELRSAARSFDQLNLYLDNQTTAKKGYLVLNTFDGQPMISYTREKPKSSNIEEVIHFISQLPTTFFQQEEYYNSIKKNAIAKLKNNFEKSHKIAAIFHSIFGKLIPTNFSKKIERIETVIKKLQQQQAEDIWSSKATGNVVINAQELYKSSAPIKYSSQKIETAQIFKNYNDKIKQLDLWITSTAQELTKAAKNHKGKRVNLFAKKGNLEELVNLLKRKQETLIKSGKEGTLTEAPIAYLASLSPRIHLDHWFQNGQLSLNESQIPGEIEVIRKAIEKLNEIEKDSRTP